MFKLTKLHRNLSAGVPLTYYHYGNLALSIENLIDNFIETSFTVDTNNTYRKSGFLLYKTLFQTFDNAYTDINGIRLKIRALNIQDISNIISIPIEKDLKLNDVNLNKLFDIGSNYYIASQYNSDQIWLMSAWTHGIYGANGGESGIRPVVSLNSLVKANNIDTLGAWNVEI